MSQFVNTGAVYKKKTKPEFDLSKTKPRTRSKFKKSESLRSEVDNMEMMLMKLKRDVAKDKAKRTSRASSRGSNNSTGSLWGNSTRMKSRSRYELENLENIPVKTLRTKTNRNRSRTSRTSSRTTSRKTSRTTLKTTPRTNFSNTGLSNSKSKNKDYLQNKTPKQQSIQETSTNPSNLLFEGTFDTKTGTASNSYAYNYTGDKYEIMEESKEQEETTKQHFNLESHPLLQGEYDERESHRSFQEALQEWRQQSSTDTKIRTEIRHDLKNHPLLQGDFNEAANARAFQDALREARGEKKEIKTEIRNELSNHPLLQGSYNENENAKEFQEALTKWRAKNKINAPTSSSGSGSNKPIPKVAKKGFTQALHQKLESCLFPTYFDKIEQLLISKH